MQNISLHNPTAQDYTESMKSHATRRKRVFERDNGICAKCGNSGTPWQVDHRVPVCANGTHKMENLQTLCLNCHYEKTQLEDRKFFKLTSYTNPDFVHRVPLHTTVSIHTALLLKRLSKEWDMSVGRVIDRLCQTYGRPHLPN